MMTASDKFISELYKLAHAVAEEAQKDTTEFDQKVKALQALTPYYAAIMKATGGDDNPDAIGGNFGAWRDRVGAVEDGANGGTQTGIQAGARRRR